MLVDRIFPSLTSRRRHLDTGMHDWDGPSRLDADLQRFLYTLGPNLTVLKLVGFENELISTPNLDSRLPSVTLDGLRVLYLNTVAASSQTIAGLLDRHRHTLKDVCFSDMGHGGPSRSWKATLTWIHDAALRLDRFVKVGTFDEQFRHYLVVRDTFTQLPGDTIELFFDIERLASSYVLVEEDGASFTHRLPFQRIAEIEHPVPWGVW